MLGAVGKLAGGQRSVLGKGAVEAELGAEVDGEQLEGADRGAEQALGEGVRGIGCGEGHRRHPWVGRSGQSIDGSGLAAVTESLGREEAEDLGDEQLGPGVHRGVSLPGHDRDPGVGQGRVQCLGRPP